MHRAYAKIIEVFEGVAAHLGVALETEWQIKESQLRGTLAAVAKSQDQDAARHALEEMTRKGQTFGTKNGLTFTTISKVGDDGISLILQIDSDINLDELVTSGIIDNYCREFAGYFEYELKKTYRRKEERPRPDLPPDSEKNRPDTRFQTRIDKDLATAVEEFRKTSGLSKKQLTERALNLLLENERGAPPKPK